jgi:type II secretory pathway component PulM
MNGLNAMSHDDEKQNEASTGKRTSHQPVLLLRNRRYPTYQLFAHAGSGKVSADSVLKIAILETLHWLRQRFRAFDLPVELDWPDASQYDTVDSKDFKTFQINEGYKVEVVWLPDEQIWALQLTEPDLGPEPGAAHQTRRPVPGRLYETNIAYHIIGEQVVCGFRTFVAEPEGTAEPSEVFRLAIIRKLANNPLVGLKQEWPLIEKPHALDTVGAIRHLHAWLRDRERMLPAVVAVAGKAQAMTKDQQMATISQSSTKTQKPLSQEQLQKMQEILSQVMRPIPDLSACMPPDISKAGTVIDCAVDKYAIDINGLARQKIGHAVFFVLPARQLEAFQNITRIAVSPGEIIICEPGAFSGDTLRFTPSGNEVESNKLFRQLDQLINDYPRDKPMRFGHVLFLAEVWTRYHELLIAYSNSKDDILRNVQKADEARIIRHQDEIADLRAEIDLRTKKIGRLNGQINNLQNAINVQRHEMDELKRQHQVSLDEKDQEIDHLKSLLCRPRHPADVPTWAELCFADRLILHPRACDMMRHLASSDVDLPLVCDALEYLAVEYRDALLGRIDETERDSCCARKYGRPFDVTPVSDKTIETYANAYKIKYGTGYTGKPVECPLNLHLRVGNAADNLLRIYFLYDREKKLIVVGSLPEHLKTASYH